MKANILNGWEVQLIDIYGHTPKNFELRQANDEWVCQYLYYLYFAYYVTTTGGHWCKDEIPLGSDGWSILGPGTASQCSEEEAKGIVAYDNDRYYRDYLTDRTYQLDTALESLHSYIRANGKEPGNIVIVIRKKN